MWRLARTGRTNDPLVIATIRARQINHLLGGFAVTPWEVLSGEIPDELLDVVVGVYQDLPAMQNAAVELEAIRAKWRARHPTYKHRT